MIRQRTNVAAASVKPQKGHARDAARGVPDAREWLIERAQDGDPAAMKLLFRLVPDPLPKSITKGMRDDEMRDIAGRLIEVDPTMTTHRAAKVLTEVHARVILSRGPLSLPPGHFFARLDKAERFQMERRLAFIAHLGGWPGIRQLQKIIGSAFELFAVESANAAAPCSARQRRSSP